jgi:hypothetical protein
MQTNPGSIVGERGDFSRIRHTGWSTKVRGITMYNLRTREQQERYREIVRMCQPMFHLRAVYDDCVNLYDQCIQLQWDPEADNFSMHRVKSAACKGHVRFPRKEEAEVALLGYGACDNYFLESCLETYEWLMADRHPPFIRRRYILLDAQEKLERTFFQLIESDW